MRTDGVKSSAKTSGEQVRNHCAAGTSRIVYISPRNSSTSPARRRPTTIISRSIRATCVRNAAVLDGLTLQLRAAGATWDDVVSRRMYALDVPDFLKVLNDRTLSVPWDVNRPSPSTLIGVTALANPGFLI